MHAFALWLPVDVSDSFSKVADRGGAPWTYPPSLQGREGRGRAPSPCSSCCCSTLPSLWQTTTTCGRRCGASTCTTASPGGVCFWWVPCATAAPSIHFFWFSSLDFGLWLALPKRVLLCPPPVDAPLAHRFQFLTSAFCHGSWAHLRGNSFFLLIFGRIVEEEEGAFGLWASYLLCGLGAKPLPMRYRRASGDWAWNLENCWLVGRGAGRLLGGASKENGKNLFQLQWKPNRSINVGSNKRKAHISPHLVAQYCSSNEPRCKFRVRSNSSIHQACPA